MRCERFIRTKLSRSVRVCRTERDYQLFLLAHRTLGDGFVDLRLDGRHIEAGAALHRREVDQRLRRLAHDLLDEHETPELVDEPIVKGDRAIVLAVEHTGALGRGSLMTIPPDHTKAIPITVPVKGYAISAFDPRHLRGQRPYAARPRR
jgi:hypothetical protein